MDVKIDAIGKSDNLQFAVTINKEGLASQDSEYIDANADFSSIDFGTIQLGSGFSQPILVLDSNGKPVAGAAVEPQSDYALRREAVRTNASGQATLKNLPAGLLRVSVAHGDQYTSPRLVVSTNPQENTLATIRITKPVLTPASMPELTKPVAVGAMAPELEIRGWSDGETRKLADYRGKIVVLDFWGVWCGPCIHAIPAMQQLAEKYEPKGVVFLGIHTADGDLDQMNKLKKSMGWKAPSGLDLGSSTVDGKTSTIYGIRAYPSVVIVDGEGKVAFNSSIMPESRGRDFGWATGQARGDFADDGRVKRPSHRRRFTTPSSCFRRTNLHRLSRGCTRASEGRCPRKASPRKADASVCFAGSGDHDEGADCINIGGKHR